MDNFMTMWENIIMVRRIISGFGMEVLDQTEMGSSVTLFWINPETGETGYFYFDEEGFVPYSKEEVEDSLRN